MKLAWLGWVLPLATAACGPKVAVGDELDTGADTDVSSATTTSSPSTTTTSSPSTTSPSTSSTTISTSSTVTTAPPTISDSADDITGGTLPDGAQCQDDLECQSGRCYVIGLLGGICGECISDDDCMGGGCTPPDPLARPPVGAVCNAGLLGDGCQSDAVCQPGLMCALILEIPNVATSQTCSQCRVDADCPGAQLCTPMPELGSLTGVKLCIDPESQPLGASCDHTTTGDQACSSGICAVADVMGLLELGVCSECETDAQCLMGQSCMPPEVDIGTDSLVPGECL